MIKGSLGVEMSIGRGLLEGADILFFLVSPIGTMLHGETLTGNIRKSDVTSHCT